MTHVVRTTEHDRQITIRTESAAVAPPTESGAPEAEHAPRTALGRDLMAIRHRIVTSGQPLLDWDEIEHEVAERRGGTSDDEG